MSDSKINDDGGPAFPHHDSGDTAMRPGMSLRDWFAGQALNTFAVQHGSRPEKVAKLAYQIADAMIAASKDGA